MIYRGQEITALGDTELTEAQMLMWASEDFYKKQTASAKAKDKFKNQPLPTMNAHFIELKAALEDEMRRRKLEIIGTESKVN